MHLFVYIVFVILMDIHTQIMQEIDSIGDSCIVCFEILHQSNLL